MVNGQIRSVGEGEEDELLLSLVAWPEVEGQRSERPSYVIEPGLGKRGGEDLVQVASGRTAHLVMGSGDGDDGVVPLGGRDDLMVYEAPTDRGDRVPQAVEGNEG